MTIAVIVLAMGSITALVLLKIRADRQERLNRALEEHLRREKIKVGGSE